MIRSIQRLQLLFLASLLELASNQKSAAIALARKKAVRARFALIADPGPYEKPSSEAMAPMDEEPGVATMDGKPGVAPWNGKPGVAPMNGKPGVAPMNGMPGVDSIIGKPGWAPLNEKTKVPDAQEDKNEEGGTHTMHDETNMEHIVLGKDGKEMFSPYPMERNVVDVPTWKTKLVPTCIVNCNAIPINGTQPVSDNKKPTSDIREISIARMGMGDRQRSNESQQRLNNGKGSVDPEAEPEGDSSGEDRSDDSSPDSDKSDDDSDNGEDKKDEPDKGESESDDGNEDEGEGEEEEEDDENETEEL